MTTASTESLYWIGKVILLNLDASHLCISMSDFGSYFVCCSNIECLKVKVRSDENNNYIITHQITNTHHAIRWEYWYWYIWYIFDIYLIYIWNIGFDLFRSSEINIQWMYCCVVNKRKLINFSVGLNKRVKLSSIFSL